MRSFSIAEYALIVWITTVYTFSADTELVWLSTIAAAVVVAVTSLDCLRLNSLVLNSVLVSRLLFVFYCAITIVGGSPTKVSVLTVAQIVLAMIAVANICLVAGSIRALEVGCYAGTVILLINSYSETGLGHSPLRYGSLLGNPNSCAFALLMGVLFAVRRLLFTRDRVPRLPARAALILLVLAASHQIVVGTGSRKGMLGLAGAAVFAILGTWWLRGRRQALRLTAPMLIVTGIVFVFSTNAPYLSRLQSLVEFSSGTEIREASAAVRAGMAREALDLWSKKPLFGWGFDQFRYVSSRGEYAHSNVLELLANGGLVGASLYYLAWAFLAGNLARRWRQTRVREDRLELSWAALSACIVFVWGLAAVQYEQKLDAAIVAALSTVPSALANRVRARETVRRKALWASYPRIRAHMMDETVGAATSEAQKIARSLTA